MHRNPANSAPNGNDPSLAHNETWVPSEVAQADRAKWIAENNLKEIRTNVFAPAWWQPLSVQQLHERIYPKVQSFSEGLERFLQFPGACYQYSEVAALESAIADGEEVFEVLSSQTDFDAGTLCDLLQHATGIVQSYGAKLPEEFALIARDGVLERHWKATKNLLFRETGLHIEHLRVGRAKAMGLLDAKQGNNEAEQHVVDPVKRAAAEMHIATTKHKTPLNAREQAVLDLIPHVNTGKSILLPDIMQALSKSSAGLDESTITGRVMPLLKREYGVFNTPKRGYQRVDVG